jgi:hypothetical protein
VINFAAHLARAGRAGASEDFEQMLGLLVGATFGEANLVFANPGDWGIDVLVGDLRGEVTIWQAKYFMPGVGTKHKEQIKASFASALKAGAANGYTVARWVLCVPSSMDGTTTQWWQGWKADREHETGIQIELWDENRLRELLLQPAAAHVRRQYYDSYRRDEPAEESARPSLRPVAMAPPVPAGWQGGAEYRLGDTAYLLHDELAERPSLDRSWVWREATADQIGPDAGRVRLRQVQLLRPVPAAEERRAALRAQAGLLSQLCGGAGLPDLVDVFDEPEVITVVTAHPPGRSWAEVFGPFTLPPDRLTAASALAAAADLCTALGVLHGRGVSHRALHTGALFVDRGEQCFLRDVGLAAVPPSAGEGEAPYRAPEQMRAPRAADARTDVYQVAAIVYHTLTTHPPTPTGTPPIRATLVGFPEPVDRALMRALDTDSAQRPDTRSLVDALRAGRRELSQGGGP